MSVLVAVDPNVLLGVTLGDRHCTWAIEGLSERAAELCLALDDKGTLFETYYGIQERLLANNVTKTFIEMFLNARQRRQRVRSAMLSDDESQWLAAELSLKEPVEPELIAVGKAAPGRPIVVVVGKEHPLNMLSRSGMHGRQARGSSRSLKDANFGYVDN